MLIKKTPENLLRIPLRTHNKFSGVYILLYHFTSVPFKRDDIYLIYL